MLLEWAYVDTDIPDRHTRTLFWWAVMTGQGSVVKPLSGRIDTNPDKVDSAGRRPLSRAAESANRKVARIPL